MVCLTSIEWVAPGLTAGRGLKRHLQPVVLGGVNVAPGLTAGRGLKLLPRPALAPLGDRCARPNRRARIETPNDFRPSFRYPVAPGLTAGRGLKPERRLSGDSGNDVAPGLTAGRGLKLVGAIAFIPLWSGCARPNRRARIETLAQRRVWGRFHVAPGLTAGRGLKLGHRRKHVVVGAVAPGLTAGRGLKRTPRWDRPADSSGCARPNRRARIETVPCL